MKKKYPMSRENWILQMYDFGDRGIEDFNHTHKKIIPASKSLIKKTSRGPRLKKLDAKLDVQGYDMPRKDIINIKLKNGTIIRVGGDGVNRDIKEFKRYILPYLNKAFTYKELEGLKIYFEYPSKNLNKGVKFSGMTSEYISNKNKKLSIIELLYKKNGPTAVHEMLHALKFKKNKALDNTHLDEAATDLEAMMRLPPRERKKIECNDGYYFFLKGNKCKARQEDAKLIEKKCNLKDKDGLTTCIKRNVKKTNIGKVKIPKKYLLD